MLLIYVKFHPSIWSVPLPKLLLHSTGGRWPGNAAYQTEHEAHIECGISRGSGEEGGHGEAARIRRGLRQQQWVLDRPSPYTPPSVSITISISVRGL